MKCCSFIHKLTLYFLVFVGPLFEKEDYGNLGYMNGSYVELLSLPLM